jgi:hypothetical protein
MTGIMLTFTEEQNRAIKLYAIKHNISKSEAAAQIIEQWLKEKGYLDPQTTYGYEYLE